MPSKDLISDEELLSEVPEQQQEEELISDEELLGGEPQAAPQAPPQEPSFSEEPRDTFLREYLSGASFSGYDILESRNRAVERAKAELIEEGYEEPQPSSYHHITGMPIYTPDTKDLEYEKKLGDLIDGYIPDEMRKLMEERGQARELNPNAALLGQATSFVSGGPASVYKGVAKGMKSGIGAVDKATKSARHGLAGVSEAAAIGTGQMTAKSTAGMELGAGEEAADVVISGAVSAIPFGKVLSKLTDVSKSAAKNIFMTTLSTLTRTERDLLEKFLLSTGEEVTRKQSINHMLDFIDTVSKTTFRTERETAEVINAGLDTYKLMVDDRLMAAAEALVEDGVTMKRSEFISILRETMAEIPKVGKKGIPGPIEEEQMAVLQKWFSYVQDYGETLGPHDVRTVIRSLDQSVDWTNKTSGKIDRDLTDKGLLILKKFRGKLDDSLRAKVKDSPLKADRKDYATIMDQHKLLRDVWNTARNEFSDPNRTLGKIGDLKKKYHITLSDDLNAFYRTSRRSVSKGDPAHPSAKTFEDLKVLQEGTKYLEQVSDQSAGPKLDSFLRGQRIEKTNERVLKQFQIIDEMSGGEFEKMLDNLDVFLRFEKRFVDGKQITPTIFAGPMLTGVLGAGAYSGRLMTPGMIAASWALVNTAGFLTKRYGGQMAKTTIKAIKGIQGLPTKFKIRRMSLPEEVKDFLEEQLKKEFVGLWSTKYVDVDKEEVPMIAYDIDRAEHLKPSQKAKMLKELKRHTRLLNPALVMFGEDKPKKSKPIKKETKKKEMKIEDVTKNIQGRKSILEFKRKQS